MTTSTAGFLEDQGYEPVSLTHSSFGHLEVQATVNGEPAHFIVDTGASATVIDKKSAARLHVTLTGDEHTAMGCGLVGQAERATVSSMKIGTVDLATTTVHVVDLSQVNDALEAKTGKRIDGVVGADLLKRGDAIIEYARDTLHLRF